MKLPQFFSKFMNKKTESREVFLSLVLDDESVSVAAWAANPKGLPQVIKTVTRPLTTDTWDERAAVADGGIAILDEAVAPARIEKVVLGLPAAYLSPDGDILPEIRTHIKEFTKALELTAIGFVPVHQAIAHTLKRDEGVPPTVILVGVGKKLTICLYKIGSLVGLETVPLTEDVAVTIEAALKGFADVEILPSRMLLFGGNHEALSEVQAKLLRHPWQTKANFLHFPKIELLPTDFAVGAVSVAGATELARSLGVEVEEVVAPKEEPVVVDENVSEEVEPEFKAQDANVVVVEPSELGFKPEPVEALEESPSEVPKAKSKLTLPKIAIPNLSGLLTRLPALGRKGPLVAAMGVAILVLLVLGGRWVLPRVQVTVLTLPQKVSSSESIKIEKTATVVSSQERTIPARTQEKTVSGESAIAASGKKKVGDPAKGTVIIFNKSTSSRALKKGAVLTANTLRFTLDSDVSVASASENLVSGTVTFGKATAPTTAADIGPQSNLPEGTEFTFVDVPSSVAIARSEKAFAGGTSRDVIVVSRADYDALTRDLTAELVDKAKEELINSVGPGEKLIDETIKTEVASKEFSQEINEEASQLQGKLTINVTGVSYNEEDIKTLLKEDLSAKLPEGYTLDQASLVSTISDVTVSRGGEISVNASLSGNAVPGVDIAVVRQGVAGKSLQEAQDVLRGMKGIAGAEFLFRNTFSKNRLPANKNNISVVIATQ